MGLIIDLRDGLMLVESVPIVDVDCDEEIIDIGRWIKDVGEGV
jgi:hypothetical protein